MGRDKASLPLGTGTFLTHLIGEYAPEFPVYVSVGQLGKFPHPGAGELVDLRPGMGPLAGLEAAFAQTDADAVFLTATDLPGGTAELANYLVEQLCTADACVICRKNGQPEPAFGVYRRSCLTPAKSLLDQGRRAFRGVFDQVQVRWVREEDIPQFPLDRLLRNVNTPEEYAAWMEQLPKTP